MVDKLRAMTDAVKSVDLSKLGKPVLSSHHGRPHLHSCKFPLYTAQATSLYLQHRKTWQETPFCHSRFPAPNVPRRPLQPLRRPKCSPKPCHHHPNTVGTAAGSNPRRPCRRPSTRYPCCRRANRRSESRYYIGASGSTAAHRRCNGRGGRRRRRAASCHGRRRLLCPTLLAEPVQGQPQVRSISFYFLLGHLRTPDPTLSRVLMDNFTPEQYERFEAYRRHALPKQAVRKVRTRLLIHSLDAHIRTRRLGR